MARMVRPSTPTPRWASYVLLAGLAVLTLWMVSAVRLAEVPSGSMEPTLHPGDLLLMRIDAFRHRLPARGDIVIFHDPTKEGDFLVKRVIGLPGEDLYYQGGVVWINGKLLKEPYLDDPFLSAEARNVLLGEDDLWVMGDNRGKTQDSRDYGPIKPSSLVGRASAIIWPLARRHRFPSYRDVTVSPPSKAPAPDSSRR